VREQPFVDAVGQQQDFDALFLEQLKLRAALGAASWLSAVMT
jgi:hypothetical protein